MLELEENNFSASYEKTQTLEFSQSVLFFSFNCRGKKVLQ